MISTLAHMGGLDEIAWFVVLAAAIIFLLRRAERRAREAAERKTADVEGSDPER
jgi:hypothetical protein